MANLITGATGFLGAYLCRTLLAAGQPVHAIRRPNSDLSLLGKAASDITWHDSDLLDPLGLEEALSGIKRVYHCAALVSFHPADREAMMRVNARGTAALVNACLEAGVERMLHVSSVAALGRSPHSESVDEGRPYEHNSRSTDYALSKHLAEREVTRGIAEGLDAVIANPATILGAGYWDRGTARFFSRAEEGIRFYTRGATGFVDVRDVARGCLLLMEQGLCGERYTLSAENLSYRELFSRICRSLDRPLPKLEAGPWLLGAVWRWEALSAALTGRRPDLTRQNARLVQHRYTYDNSKFIALTGMRYRPLAQSLEETARVYRQSRQEGRNFGLLELETPADS
jgi:dihydroflavonol-4-reductase